MADENLFDIIKQIGKVLLTHPYNSGPNYDPPSISPELQALLAKQDAERGPNRIEIMLEQHASNLDMTYRMHHKWMDDWLERFHKIINDSDLPVVEPAPPPAPPRSPIDFAPSRIDDDDIPF